METRVHGDFENWQGWSKECAVGIFRGTRIFVSKELLEKEFNLMGILSIAMAAQLDDFKTLKKILDESKLCSLPEIPEHILDELTKTINFSVHNGLEINYQ